MPASHFRSILVDEAVVNGAEGEFDPVRNVERRPPGHSGLGLTWVDMHPVTVDVASCMDRYTAVNSA
jgi:hypothetical protein